MDTQTQIDRLIELAIIQRSELKQLVEQLPQLREHLNAEVEKVFEEAEPQLRAELEDWTTKQTSDKAAALGAALEAKITDLAKSLEISTQARYNAIIAEREENTRLAAQAEQKIAEHAASLPSAVKDIVTAELARFPRAGEIDQLRKEFAEPKSLNPRGKWQAGETYNKLDLVTINGDSYTSAIDGNKTRPTRSSADWTLVAARGTGGGGGPTSLTDLTAVPQNGELLIGNGSAFVNNTLTAGTGVTITNGAGTITIDASGAQELLTATVKNADSVAITKGQVVYLFGATGGFPSVKLANNTSDATSNKTFGVVSDTSIAPNGTGTVTCVGVVDKLNLGAYNDGDAVYLGATDGTFTATKPYAPNHLVFVGIIERANAGNGELYVRIQNGYELEELHNVQITTPPLAGSLLMYDATNSLWKANRLTGTANQITVTNADTAVTLSIPTNPTLNGNATVTGTLTTNSAITGPTLAPGVNTAAHYFTAYGATTSWPLRLSTIYDSNYVDQYLTLNGTLTGSRATPTFTGAAVGGSFIRSNGENSVLSVGTFVSGAGAAINTVAVFNPTNVTIPQTTASTTISSGALVVSGGVGVAKRVTTGERILANASVSAAASTISTGATLYAGQIDNIGYGTKLLFDHSFGTPESQTRGAFVQSRVDVFGFSSDVGLGFGTTSGGSISEKMFLSSGGNLIIGSPFTDGGQKLQVNGAATFSGAVTVVAAGSRLGANAEMYNLAGEAYLQVYSDDATISRWRIATNGTALEIQDNYNVRVPLSFAGNTQAATFAGAIAIGNTVNTVSPTSPNRTITMVIGGVTYYLHAKTTND